MTINEHVRIERDLYMSMQEEAMASRLYRERAFFAQAKGDSKTAELYEHIAGEEDVHYKEFEKHLEEVSKSYIASGCSCKVREIIKD